jgi:hypothetical protein
MSPEVVNGVQRWPPSQCDMPDLSGLFPHQSLNFALNRMFGGAGPKDPNAYALVMNFIRCADGAIGDYEAARMSFLAFLSAVRLRSHGCITSC